MIPSVPGATVALITQGVPKDVRPRSMTASPLTTPIFSPSKAITIVPSLISLLICSSAMELYQSLLSKAERTFSSVMTALFLLFASKSASSSKSPKRDSCVDNLVLSSARNAEYLRISLYALSSCFVRFSPVFFK